MKIKSKLLLGAGLLSLVPVLVTSVVLSSVSLSTSSQALEQQVQSQLVSLREAKKNQIEDYFRTINHQLLNLATAPVTQEMLAALPNAINDLLYTHSFEVAPMRQELRGYYENDFSREYRAKNPGETASIDTLLSHLSEHAVILQNLYIHQNHYPLGEKNQLHSIDHDSHYNDLHKQFHPYFDDFVERFEYYDLFLIDDQGRVAYSVFKELDFGTNLRNGPYANSGLATVYNRANAIQSGQMVIEDFAPYLPSYNDPAGFIATPVFQGNKRLGVLVLQMPINTINAIMTNNEQWRDEGLGDSGETYLVAQDKRPRSISRFILEDKLGYLAMLRDLNVASATVSAIDSRNTNIGLQEIDTQGSRAALAGQSGFAIFPDYRGVEVLSAYAPLSIEGLSWALLSEIDKEEAFRAVENMRSSIIGWAMLVSLCTVAVALLVGLWFSISLTRPIQESVKAMRNIAEGDGDLTLRLKDSGKDELAEVAQAFNQFAQRVQDTVREVDSATNQLSVAAEELSAVTIQNKQSIESQRIETEQVATAMNEMTATVHEVAHSAETAAESARRTGTHATEGAQLVQQTINDVQSLVEGIQQTAVVIESLGQDIENITTVLDVIRNIAGQTNLLALNAAIEAARAGQHGRGFAVVADEVRNLASRTQDSTAEIEKMVDTLQSSANNAVTSMQSSSNKAQGTQADASNVSKALDAITQAVRQMNEMNEQIAVAAEQQSSVADEINRNIININDVTEQTVVSAEQTNGSSQQLAELAGNLQNLVSRFKF